MPYADYNAPEYFLYGRFLYNSKETVADRSAVRDPDTGENLVFVSGGMETAGAGTG